MKSDPPAFGYTTFRSITADHKYALYCERAKTDTMNTAQTS